MAEGPSENSVAPETVDPISAAKAELGLLVEELNQIDLRKNTLVLRGSIDKQAERYLDLAKKFSEIKAMLPTDVQVEMNNELEQIAGLLSQADEKIATLTGGPSNYDVKGIHDGYRDYEAYLRSVMDEMKVLAGYSLRASEKNSVSSGQSFILSNPAGISLGEIKVIKPGRQEVYASQLDLENQIQALLTAERKAKEAVLHPQNQINIGKRSVPVNFFQKAGQPEGTTPKEFFKKYHVVLERDIQPLDLDLKNAYTVEIEIMNYEKGTWELRVKENIAADTKTYRFNGWQSVK